MANDETGVAAAPGATSPLSGGRQAAGRRSFTQWLLATETGFSFVKGLTFISFAGTLIAAYFQYLSAYQDKVQTQAKEDLAAATSAFVETSNALSTPMTLQGLLYLRFRAGDETESRQRPERAAEQERQRHVQAL